MLVSCRNLPPKFIGHHAVALAAKKISPRTSLGWLVLGVTFLDLIWPIFVLVGWERVAIHPGDTAFTPLEFIAYPWSHSLAMVLVWSLIVGALYSALTRDRRGALVVGLCVLSHWILDWATHRADMPLWPHGPTFGLGLWNSVSATFTVELAMLAVGTGLYLRAARPRPWAFAAYLSILLITYLAATLGPPPPSVKMLAWGALLSWVFPVWAWWADRS